MKKILGFLLLLSVVASTCFALPIEAEALSYKITVEYNEALCDVTLEDFYTNAAIENGGYITEDATANRAYLVFTITNIPDGYRIGQVTENNHDITNGIVSGAYGGCATTISQDTIFTVSIEPIPQELPEICGGEIYLDRNYTEKAADSITFTENSRIYTKPLFDADSPTYFSGCYYEYSTDKTNWTPYISWGNRLDFWAGWAYSEFDFVNTKDYYIRAHLFGREYYSTGDYYTNILHVNPELADGIIDSGSYGSLTWVLNDAGELSIQGSGDMPELENPSDAPWYKHNNLITEIQIGEKVGLISDVAFRECYSLKSIVADENNAYYCSADNVLFNKDKTSIVKYPCALTNEVYSIPDTVTQIEAYAFYRCNKLKKVLIGDHVTHIGKYAFSRCYKLEEINLPAQIEEILPCTFSNCEKLTEITIPNGVSKIGLSAFSYCTSLKEVTVLNGTISIGNWAFEGCSVLESIHLPASLSEIKTSAFGYCSLLKDVYYAGTSSQWNSISIATGNDCLTGALVHFEGITIQDGAYVQLGTYYNEPILWRCAYNDSNGAFLLSDKQISMKCYSGGTNQKEPGSSSTWGNARWAISDLRSWLNSAEPAGSVTWLDGTAPDENASYRGYNAYDDESGFLSEENFSYEESMLMKRVSRKSYLAPKDAAYATHGTTYHIYGDVENIETVEVDFDNIYAELVEDKVFIPNLEELKKVHHNADCLGDSYYYATPTDIAKAKTECSYSDEWDIWIDQPANFETGLEGEHIYTIDKSGTLGWRATCGSDLTGIRPAFYLSEDAEIVSGDGTKSAPYILKYTAPYVHTTQATENGTSKFTVAVNNFENDCVVVIALYDSGKLVEIKYQAYNGENVVFETNKAYTTAKMMLWENMETLHPICSPEIITLHSES